MIEASTSFQILHTPGSGSSLNDATNGIIHGGADFCFLQWVYFGSLGTARNLFELYDTVNSRAAFRINLTTTQVNVSVVDVTTGTSLASRGIAITSGITGVAANTLENKWALIGASLDNSGATSTIRVHVGYIDDVGTARVVSSSASGTFTAADFAVGDYNRVRWGIGTTATAQPGGYGAAMLFAHICDATDITAIADLRRANGAMLYSGGNFTGSGLRFALHHAMISAPDDLDGGTGTASLPDSSGNTTVTTANLTVYDSGRSSSFFNVATTSTTSVAGSPTYRDPNYSGWSSSYWNVGSPTGADTNSIAGRAPVLRSLAIGTATGTKWIGGRSNSRGQGTPERLNSDATLRDMENYGGGWRNLRQSVCSGAFQIRPTVSADSVFGIDFAGGGSGIAKNNANNVSTSSSFTRFGSGASAGGLGGGAYVRIQGDPSNTTVGNAASNFIQPMSNAVSGSLYSMSSPGGMRVLLLKYPGAPTVTISKAIAASINSSSPTLSGDTAYNLDTATQSGTPTVVSYTSGTRTLVITGTGHGILPGHGVFCRDGASVGNQTIEIVESATEGGGNTTIITENAFDAVGGTTKGTAGGPPAAGWDVRTGPIGFQECEVSFTGSEGQNYRGLRITITTANIGDCVWYEEAHWCDGGFVIGSDGWSGNGFVNQRTTGHNAYADPVTGLTHWQLYLQALDPDEWIWYTANNQGADGSAQLWDELTTAYRSAVPGVKVAWLLESAIGTSSTNQAESTGTSSPVPFYTDAYTDGTARTSGVCFLSIYDQLGLPVDQLAHGYRRDNAHYSQVGCMKLANEWAKLAGGSAAGGSGGGAALGDVVAGSIARRLLLLGGH